jgi:hypothetical protein
MRHTDGGFDARDHGCVPAVVQGGRAAYVGLPMEALIAPWRNQRVAQQQFADQNTMGNEVALVWPRRLRPPRR